jgi:hypothetical protein
MDDLDTRVNRLERSIYIHRLVILALVVAGFSLGAAQSRVPEVVRSRAIEVVTAENQVIFRVDQRFSGGRLRIFNTSEKPVFEVDSLTSGAHLVLNNDDGLSYLSVLSGGSVGQNLFVTADVPIDLAYPGLDTKPGVQRKWPIANVMDAHSDEPRQFSSRSPAQR